MLAIVLIWQGVILLICKIMERENQYTIIDKESGLVLFCKKDDIVIDGQVAITEMYTLENPEFKEIYYNFETKQFYTK
jgi:hypothetical protein